MTTDLDRLEKVRSGQLIGRGVGKTYTSCYDVCEYLKINEDGVVFWYLPNYSWQDYIMKMLCQLLEEFEFKFNRHQDTLVIEPKRRVYFKVINMDNAHKRDYDISQATRGFQKYFNVYDSLYSYQGDY